MQCFVYKGERKPDHYIYLPMKLSEGGDEPELPKAIIQHLGELHFVLEFELTEDRKLPQADPIQVKSDMQEQGFYLQMPKQDMLELEDKYFA